MSPLAVVLGFAGAPVGFALAAGTVAAFNPCGFAMLPAYLSFFVSGSDAECRRHPVARALTVTAAMTAGFVLVFGASYATVSLSCTLPVFLAAVTGSFRSGSLLGGMAAYGAYALGMGLAVGVVTLAVALAEDGIVRRLRGVLPHVNRVAGALLVVTGAYVAYVAYVAYYGYFEVRQLRGDRVAAGPVAWVSTWSGQVTGWLDGIGALALAVVLAGGAVAAVALHRRRAVPNHAD